MSYIKYMEVLDNIIVKCPYCNDSILIEQLNCCIFRHGVLKSNGKQINPHATKELCEFYVKNKLINGCGKPFIIQFNENLEDINSYIAIKCNYI